MNMVTLTNAAAWNGEQAMALYLSGKIKGLEARAFIRYVRNADQAWRRLRELRRRKNGKS
jgi:hypothetical protein